jgi:hypothetical protein
LLALPGEVLRRPDNRAGHPLVRLLGASSKQEALSLGQALVSILVIQPKA